MEQHVNPLELSLPSPDPSEYDIAFAIFNKGGFKKADVEQYCAKLTPEKLCGVVCMFPNMCSYQDAWSILHWDHILSLIHI
ncbi:MAG: hypothetical protein N3A02_00165 [Rectinema sp.]|nr:hypothetical protein [Rectinema sp.]